MNNLEHQGLVNIITSVHVKLRKALHTDGNADKVWKNHIADENSRNDYSKAMLQLATNVWNDKESRIIWTYNTCINYFFEGGLKRSLQRELRKEGKSNNESQLENQNLKTYSSQKLKLLDVGSCYNPFSKFPEFSCVAIDLTPATKDVLQCDFLNLEISNQSLTFHEGNFDIVVMSLVLEYLPSCLQRTVFCIKAWQLLQSNGLFVIITPDSKSVNHNAPMMKSWKQAMERIGFVRVKYQKLTHLHCMAFRKRSGQCSVTSVDESLSKLMYIPQDFRDYNDDDEVSVYDRTEKEDGVVGDHFSELPFL